MRNQHVLCFLFCFMTPCSDTAAHVSEVAADSGLSYRHSVLMLMAVTPKWIFPSIRTYVKTFIVDWV